VDVVFATTTATVTHPDGGTGFVVRKGSHWPAGDPVVAAHPDMFSDDPRYGMNYSREPAGWDAPVEQATAAPGERRQTRRVESRG
jgi:hypothetical protein